MAKITREAIQKSLEELYVVTIEGYEISIKKNITLATKEKMAREIIKEIETNEASQELIEIITIGTVLSNITDIEFGETLEEKINTLYWLEDKGISQRLTEYIPTKIIEDFTAYLTTVAEAVQEVKQNGQAKD
jgi:flagellin-specific chaperone FliS